MNLISFPLIFSSSLPSFLSSLVGFTFSLAGYKMAQASGSVNRIFLAQFRPDSTNKFVSVGMRHVRFWSLVGSRLLSKRGSFVSYAGSQKMQTMLSLAFAPVSKVKGPVYLHMVLWYLHMCGLLKNVAFFNTCICTCSSATSALIKLTCLKI